MGKRERPNPVAETIVAIILTTTPGAYVTLTNQLRSTITIMFRFLVPAAGSGSVAGYAVLIE